jgi:uncharacterized delta-60 repeat protein
MERSFSQARSTPARAREFGLARYTARGRLDPSFGRGGKVTTRFGAGHSGSEAVVLAIQPDGKIVALGSWWRSAIHGPTFIALARYTTRGRLDPSFGHGGKLVTSIGAVFASSPGSLLIQRDGKLVVIGGSANGSVALARYQKEGTLDRSFGRGGRVVTKLFKYTALASPAVLQGDGKIVVDANDLDRSYFVRYTVDGKLDSTFGRGGKAVRTDTLPLLALQRDGKFVVAGSASGRWRMFAVHRYRPDGGVDSSFGRDGKVFIDFGSSADANAVAVQANGKIVVAGSRSFKDFAVARYTNAGSLDGSFGNGGRVTTDFGSAWRTR